MVPRTAAKPEPAPKEAGNARQRAPGEPRAKPVRIVGIGASAGGLEAFTALLRNLPTNAGVAYVLVQHLDPTHRSLLSELLGRATTLPVREIVDNSRVEANQIYVIPPNRMLSVENGVLKLTPRKKNGGPARSIDHFLKSLAADQKERAMAVILSGAASDGAEGLKAVKAAGGLTFAQDEASAKYNSMPRAAAATGCVDFVLPPEKIANEIARLIRDPGATKGRAAANAKRRKEVPTESWFDSNQRLPKATSWPAAPSDANLRKLFMLLRARTGIDFSLYKPNTIRRRLQRRMSANKIRELGRYVRFAREHPAEVEALYRDLLINVSSFFRNPASFELLKRKVFPKLAKARGDGEPLRFWVTACAAGQEAYSLAIAYTEFAEKSGNRPPLQIFATDVNGSVLETARSGRYDEAHLAGVSRERLQRFFVRENGKYRVEKSIRDMVVFAQHNLITDPPFTRVDLITCRNVLIYLDAALHRKILPTFHYALRPEGFLWLGASESTGQFTNLFASVDKTSRLYSKKAASSWIRLERPPTLPPMKRTAAPEREPEPQQFSQLDAQKEADRLILNKYAPATVLINEQMEVLQLRGELSHYLKLPSGKATFNLLKMARDGLSFALQRAVQKARRDGRNSREKGIFLPGRRLVDFEVVPLKNFKHRFFLVLFRDTSRQKIPHPAEIGSHNGNGRAHAAGGPRQQAEARQELMEVREQLNSMQEEYETAVEELQASNEEVQSSNEELQSLNEELETSNEELESANEELTTLNEELATRNTELRESEQQLREQAQLLTMAPIIARSLKDRIIFWSGGAEQMYGFTQEEAMAQTSHLLLNAHFFEPLESVQKKLLQNGEWAGEVEHRHKDGRIIHVSTRWVLHHDAQNKPRAILEVNTDISARKQAERALKDSEEFNRSILESSPDCMKVLDTNAHLVFMNAVGHELMEIMDVKERANVYWPDLWEGEGRSDAEAAVRAALDGRCARFKGLQPTGRGTPKWWDVIVAPVHGQEGRVEKLLCVLRDITEQKMAEEELQQRSRLAALRTDISLAVASADELRPTLQKISDALTRHLDLAFARIWLLKEGDQVLHLHASSGMYTHLDGAHSRIRLGEYKIGRIAQEKAPHLHNDVQNDPEVSDPEWARREGMVAFAGYPLSAGETVLGVLAVFARRPLPEGVLNELAFAAESIAQYLQRQRAEKQRQEAQEKLNRYAEDLERSVAERTASLRQTIGELEAFSYSVSHDLRTPLRAMEGYARALLEDCADKLAPEHYGYLERIVRGAGRLDRLTLDVLAYSRVSRAECAVHPVDLNRLLSDILDQYPQFASAKARIEIEGELLPVMGHPALLTQCISNLLGNALKFVDEGKEPQVRIFTEKAGENVRLYICDNGIGIAAEHRERLFKLFGRVHDEKRYDGTGIGLAVVKRAVDRMGGAVDFESQPGRGTQFWIELPQAAGCAV